MDYQDIPFVIWAKNQKTGHSIGKILGRKQNTHIKCEDPNYLYDYLEYAEYFACYVFHIEENNVTDLEELIVATQKKCPMCPIILFSFQKITDVYYRSSIRSGISDILISNGVDDHIELRKDLLRVLNFKWKAYRYFESEKKKILQATVVTAHHEINQPLTVIMNSIGMLNLEIEKLSLKIPTTEKFFKLITKAISKIQDILVRLKRIENPQLKEYTRGVPMIKLEEIDEEEDTKSILIEKNPEKNILVIDNNVDTHKLVKSIIKEEEYNVLFSSNGTEAIRQIKSMQNKIDIVLINVDLSSIEIGELLFQIRINTIEIPVILLSKCGETNRVQKFIKEGANSFLPIPFNVKQLRTAIEKNPIF